MVAILSRPQSGNIHPLTKDSTLKFFYAHL